LIQFKALAAEDGGFDLGDVELSFGRQTGGDFVEGVGFLTVEKVLDGTFAGVVGGQGQPPVVETAMEVLEIFGSGDSALVRGQALIECLPLRREYHPRRRAFILFFGGALMLPIIALLIALLR